ncbi:hypothetical protein HN011_001239 [Eciton burchellii]|nr:hypothetical protein HN011_001239 [Eciton burchellii]
MENMKQHYKRNLQGLREAYANLIIGVEAGCRTIQQLGKDCAALTKIPKHYGAPSLFRIVLIGPPGSGYQTLAKDLSERFNLIHVNFNYILAQACFQETALEEILLLSEHRCEQQIKPEIRIQIVKEFLLRPECLKTGWIMTNFPKTVEDFKFLDMIPTPPNRVIILTVDIETCRRRLICCQQSKDIESEYGLTLTYSENYRNIKQSLHEYQENIGPIMRYVGDSASIINATGDRKLVRERLEACLIRAAPSTRIRIADQPCPAKKLDVEFDPDDELDPSILDDIRAAEPKYCFI